MSQSHSTVLRFEYPTATAARRVERSIAVEVGELDDDRSGATVAREAAVLTVTIEATDRVALRAGINSWCRYVATAETVADDVLGRPT
ncbi:KEOPS complex Pcc1-like subunit [Halonotius terrestris]|uniref:KEOPS complex Pcc1-like subunit n=1 Tax=Halonotius terrestris TaxID=2487750 RepID=A0A8J8PFH4_9EURY|nr:KEOPS complex subunit Pcc1 [Halonotius terrestris]TQQ83687.1 KEOPS complex Pcc1-like subunit [Halonotius terrestris]